MSSRQKISLVALAGALLVAGVSSADSPSVIQANNVCLQSWDDCQEVASALGLASNKHVTFAASCRAQRNYNECISPLANSYVLETRLILAR